MNNLALGDLHIGKRHKVTFGDPAIWDELTMKVVIELLKLHKPKHLILTGDVFDSSKPTALDFAQVVMLTSMVDRVTILTGNHDLSMIAEDIAFSYLSRLPNVTLVEANHFTYVYDGAYAVGWCDTQEEFIKTMAMALRDVPENGVVYAHCNRKYWENDNDNSFTDELYDLAASRNITVISGHEHTSSISNHFIHLGSVVPQARNQLNQKYGWADDKLLELPMHWASSELDVASVYFLEEDPIDMSDFSCYLIRNDKEVKAEDLKLESKDLTIDVIESFRAAAVKEGFGKELLDEYL